MICSCFADRGTKMADAARAGAHDVDAVEAELKAGTNCGSCRPAISRIISDAKVPQGVRTHVTA
jgi:assimilatory nitrate reductase catalytic subunit